MKILVTGADGFIGSEFIRSIARNWPQDWTSLVGLMHGRSNKNLSRLGTQEINNLEESGHIEFKVADLTEDLSGLCESVNVVVNFAAKTFVDHSIRDPEPFTNSNVVGTQRLLEEARRCKVKRFYQVSTDEVYGSILHGAHREDAPINPTNPYSASKAAADALVQSYAHAYGMHVTITRTENNYGTFQHPQKVFPTFVRKIIAGQKLPVYGDGGHVRQWLHVSDHVGAILFLMSQDYASGEVFHVAGNQELTNLELAERVFSTLKPEQHYMEHVEFIEDHNIRPGHDRRYALDSSKLRNLGWSPQVSLGSGIASTALWYSENMWWNR